MSGDLARRFHEGKGECYLKTDPTKVRCQGCSKSKLRALRIEHMNPELTCDDVWPEAQCTWAAEEGTFGCRLHGGKKKGERADMLDYVPIDLRQKIEIFQANNVELLNRANEIAQLKARNAQLFESMDELAVGAEGYMAVKDALDAMKRGELVQAQRLLEIALQDGRSEKEAWFEIRENDKLIDKLTNTHLNMAEKLRLMATADQVHQLMESVFKAVSLLVDEFVDDPRRRIIALRKFSGVLRSVTNIRQGAFLSDGK